MCINASANSSDDVCSFHSIAFSMYFATSMAPIHSIVPSFCAGVVGMLGMCALLALRWSVVTPGVVRCGVVACVCGVVVVVP
jgi:hypothetical protein